MVFPWVRGPAALVGLVVGLSGCAQAVQPPTGPDEPCILLCALSRYLHDDPVRPPAIVEASRVKVAKPHPPMSMRHKPRPAPKPQPAVAHQVHLHRPKANRRHRVVLAVPPAETTRVARRQSIAQRPDADAAARVPLMAAMPGSVPIEIDTDRFVQRVVERP